MKLRMLFGTLLIMLFILPAFRTQRSLARDSNVTCAACVNGANGVFLWGRKGYDLSNSTEPIKWWRLRWDETIYFSNFRIFHCSESFAKEVTMDGTEYNRLINYLNTKEYPDGLNLNEKRALRKRSESFIMFENKLYYKMKDVKEKIPAEKDLRLVIPRDEKDRILSACHITSGSHLGVDKTTSKVNERYYWKGIIKDVREYVKNCDICQKSNKKTKTTKPEMQPIPVPPSTWKKIAIDLVGPYNDDNGKPLSDSGFKYILTVIDFFSNYTEAFPLFNKQAVEVADKLFLLFCRHGVPLELVSDNGGEFNAALSTAINEKYGYKHITISPYNPQANGKCERVNQTLKGMLNKTVNEQSSKWERFLPQCLFSYNTSKHSTTLYSPFYLMYWRNPVLPNEQELGNSCNTFAKYEELTVEQIDQCATTMLKVQQTISENVMVNIDNAQTRQKTHFDKRHNIAENEFKEGDNVLIKNRKRKKGMDKQNWLGPYVIDKVVKMGTYRIVDLNNNKTIGTYKQMNIKKYNNPNPRTMEVNAEVHIVENYSEEFDLSDQTNENIEKEAFEEDNLDKSTSKEGSDQNNNNDEIGALDESDSIFLTQNVFNTINTDDEIEIIEQFIITEEETTVESERPKRKCREKKRQSSIYEYFQN